MALKYFIRSKNDEPKICSPLFYTVQYLKNEFKLLKMHYFMTLFVIFSLYYKHSESILYRVSQKYGTLYATLGLNLVRLTNLGIVSIKMLQTFFDIGTIGKEYGPFQRPQISGALTLSYKNM